MRYRAVKLSNVEEYLAHGIGQQAPQLRPIWNLHSVVPSQFDEDGIKVIQWLVVLQSDDDFVPSAEGK